GDSLQVMASLAEREGLRGKVQCIYLDPPYGIKFNSNFQWSTTSRDVKDGKPEHITREPEQVKAFRDTWRDGIHSYLTYLRDRLTVCRDLLHESGSIFVQIGDENVHRVRALMDEVFGEDNFVGLIVVQKTSAPTDKFVPTVSDFIVWYGKQRASTKYRQLNLVKEVGETGGTQYVWAEENFQDRKLTMSERMKPALIANEVKIFAASDASSSHEYSLGKVAVLLRGKLYDPRGRYWSTSPESMRRLGYANRLIAPGRTLFYKRFLSDFPVRALSNIWTDTSSSFGERLYVVQTNSKIIERCILMATDPGDLVLDPTCGSGTTAYVAEQWGRRWITIDTSRVALALARARIMGARYPYYLLADSPEGRQKEAEITGKPAPDTPTHGDIRHGFVYK
ncbi:site-specific DNA-methyltransferase, partial [Candidatus Parcubacteria bacterium]